MCVQAEGRWQVAGAEGNKLFSLLWVKPGEGGHSLIWPIRVCAAEQGMVFRLLSLKQGAFLDRKPRTGGVNFGGVRSMFVINKFFKII